MHINVLRHPEFKAIAQRVANAPHDRTAVAALADKAADVYGGDPDNADVDFIKRALPVEHYPLSDSRQDRWGRHRGTRGFVDEAGVPHLLTGRPDDIRTIDVANRASERALHMTDSVNRALDRRGQPVSGAGAVDHREAERIHREEARTASDPRLARMHELAARAHRHALVANYQQPTADTPLAEHNHGPERYQLFKAIPAHQPDSTLPLSDDYAIHWTLRVPGRKHVHLVVPMNEEQLVNWIRSTPHLSHDWHKYDNEYHRSGKQQYNPNYKGEATAKEKAARKLMRPQDARVHDALVSRVRQHRDSGALGRFLLDHNRANGHLLTAHAQRGDAGLQSGTFIPLVKSGVGVGSSLYRGTHENGVGAIHVYHRPIAGGKPYFASVPVYSKADARALLSDTPAHVQAHFEQHLIPHLPPIEPQKRLARMQAPAGGAIVNNQMTTGGQFIPQVFARIKKVAAGLMSRKQKLARPPGVIERGPRLTHASLRQLEDTFGLPESKRLSTKVEPTPSGHFTAPVEHIAKFFEDLVSHRLPRSKTIQQLRDPAVTNEAKLQYLITHLGHELRSLRGQSANGITDWYGKHINTLDAAIHRQFAKFPTDPFFGTLDSNGELVGKDNAPAHHPGTVLFKALVAATSASQNPKNNLKTAISAWRAGEQAAGGHDPFLAIPRVNEPALAEWRAQAGPIPEPPSNLHAKAKWYIEHVHGKGLVPGYAASPDVKLLHRPDRPELHGLVVGMPKNDFAKLSPSDREKIKANARLANPMVRAGNAKIINADLPLGVNGLQPKGWSVRKEGVAGKIGQLQALVSHFSGRGRTRLEAWQLASQWLLGRHDLSEFDRLSKATKGVLPSGKAIRDASTALEPGEKVPGSFILGKKFGPFFLNLHMNHESTREPNGSYLTADKWFSRTMNRYVARLFGAGDRPSADTLREAPSAKESRLWSRAARHVSKALGVSVAELQADLWYYEQQLWRMYGGKSMPSYNFGDAVEKLRLARTQSEAIDRLGAIRAARGQTIPLGRLIPALTAVMIKARLARPPEQAFAFLSPSRTAHPSMKAAEAEYPAAVSIAQRAATLPGVTRATPAFGVWTGAEPGAEPSVVLNGESNAVRSAATNLAKQHDQDAILHFVPGSGDDVLHRFTVADSPDDINRDLTKLGIINKTIIPGDKSTVYVVDMGNDNRERLVQYAVSRHAPHDVIPGHANLVLLK